MSLPPLRARFLAGRAPHSVTYKAQRPRPRGPAPDPAAGARRGSSRSPQPSPRGAGRTSLPPSLTHIGVSDLVQSGPRGLGTECQARHASLGCRRARIPLRGRAGGKACRRGKLLPLLPQAPGTMVAGPAEEVMHGRQLCRDSSALGSQRSRDRNPGGG